MYELMTALNEVFVVFYTLRRIQKSTKHVEILSEWR